MSFFPAPISEDIWTRKYRFGNEAGVEDSWRRVARAVASVEGDDAGLWEQRFVDLLSGFRFLPGGRILANAGTARSATLLNCFVMGDVHDSIDGLFSALRESASNTSSSAPFSTWSPPASPGSSSR